MTNNNDRLHTGELYLPNDPELEKRQFGYLDQLNDFNQTRPSELTKRQILLSKMFAEIGPKCYIEPPFHSNFGGHHVHFGKGVYANFNLTLVDDTHIYVGDYTMFGPNVTIATAGHPILPSLREQAYQYNICQFISAVTVGSAQVPSYYPVLRLATMSSLALVAS
ncbi:Galactoside O-acetyltransferase [Lactiplantibacillus plantarum]|nr:Galactoside O-acetyltransferase [Lactiplantibacillus plantarum]